MGSQIPLPSIVQEVSIARRPKVSRTKLYLAAYSHAMSVASTLAVLSAIASGMIALTGIVFALAFVMVQFSAVAYSPRLVAWFGRDPLLFRALGLFTATLIFMRSRLWPGSIAGGTARYPCSRPWLSCFC